MTDKRSAGILLHPTSLPGKFGIGDLGPNAYKFIDFLEASGQTLWQVFPLGPTGYGDSPYQCLSAFAGNPMLLSPEVLLHEGLLSDEDIDDYPVSNKSHIDYGELITVKSKLLKKAYKNFKKRKLFEENEFCEYCIKENSWLDDYTLFAAAKNFHNDSLWTEWEEEIAVRKPEALLAWKEKLADKILYHKFLQFKFYSQWKKLKAYANENNIKIIGDMPIFIAYDSADLWANKELFTVDENGKLLTVAGVPPDYFSATGQLWGNPLYKWDVMKKDDYAWWRKRFTALLQYVDIIRIDHFRGFEAFWEIPGDAPTAETGKWIKAPGDDLFTTIRKYLGVFPIIAEDLGIITPPVEALRDKFNLPGMRILQFAFGKDMEKKFLPHNYVKNTVVHTGSHDNDTTRAYFEKAKDQNNDIYSFMQRYLNYYGENVCIELIRLAYSSVANIVVIPMQDVLNLGSDARMNFPGTLGGNWTWRLKWSQITPDLAKTYKTMVELYERESNNRIK